MAVYNFLPTSFHLNSRLQHQNLPRSRTTKLWTPIINNPVDKEATNTIKIKLAVDRPRNRVLFADASSDFVDVLLSFLTLPISSLQFCAGKASPGSLSSLCESVNHLRESKLLKAEACHGMLLCPRHVLEFNVCNVSHRKPCDYYKHMFVKNQPSLQAQNQQCSCWEVMGRLVHVYNQASGSSFSRFLQRFPWYNEMFVERKERFVISDDWVIKPASTSNVLSLLQRIDADIGKGFEEVEVIVSWAQVVSMLKSSLSSETVLSGTFLSKELAAAPVNPKIRLGMSSKQETLPRPPGKESDCPLPQFNVKFFFNKGSPCAKKMLLEPTLAPFRMGYQDRDGDPGENSDPELLSDLFSEKLELAMDRVYVVEDNLRISQASAMSVAKHWCNKDIEVLEMDVTMTKKEAIVLMRSVLTSKTALTDAFRSRM